MCKLDMPWVRWEPTVFAMLYRMPQLSLQMPVMRHMRICSLPVLHGMRRALHFALKPSNEYWQQSS